MKTKEYLESKGFEFPYLQRTKSFSNEVWDSWSWIHKDTKTSMRPFTTLDEACESAIMYLFTGRTVNRSDLTVPPPNPY
jgi:hypothetical protein